MPFGFGGLVNQPPLLGVEADAKRLLAELFRRQLLPTHRCILPPCNREVYKNVATDIGTELPFTCTRAENGTCSIYGPQDRKSSMSQTLSEGASAGRRAVCTHHLAGNCPGRGLLVNSKGGEAQGS